jgi:glycosyltransferase involved in cell wall biosynthesis
MRICHVVGTDQGWGGMERGVLDLATIQSAAHDVLVAGAPCVIERLKPPVATAEIPVHLNRRDPRLIWALRQVVRKFRPDIIHAHANKAAAVVNLARFFLPRVARVVTVHGTKRSTRVFNPYDRVIAVSRRAGQQLSRSHVIIWNGIRGEEYDVSNDGSELPFVGRAKPVLLAVGRLVRVKGFDLLIRALKSVDAFLWLVGDGPLKTELEAQARADGVADRVWFAGFRDDVGRLMEKADALVISSRQEGFPFVLVEALHHRRPVISTRVGGAEEVLPEKWLCDGESVTALEELLHRALGCLPTLPAEFEPIFALAQRELTLDASSRKVEAVYREAIAGVPR